ncbi:MAG TPA: Gfo/Idh/MocA family oxidoreductase [Sphingomonas sp.]|nr:Gfo/Idh/MocA family oxidoreductase [Sphingomonas sp.]
MLRGVIVGSGYFSQFHFDAWHRLEGVAIVAACSHDPAALATLASGVGISRLYGDVARMLDVERPDFIDIVTPPDSHASIVKLAADRGVAVICQKALAPSFDEARAIVATTQAANIRFMVHDNFRFQPWHREFRKLIDGGVIGEIQNIACRTRLGDGWGDDAYLARQPYFRLMPQLLVYETGVHFIDVFRFLGGEISSVFARLRRLNPVIAGEDRALLLFELENGATALWDADRYHASLAADPRLTFGEFLIEGSEGALRLDEDGEILIHRLGQQPVAHDYRFERRGFAGDSVFATCQHFAERLRRHEPFELEGAAYLRTLAVQEAVYRSACSTKMESVAAAA